MMTADYPTSDRLSNQLAIWSQMQLTGRLDVQADSSQQWNLYFCRGRLVWARGGLHIHRRWQRLLSQYCQQLYAQNDSCFECDVVKGEDYNLLKRLVKQHQITGEQAASVIRNTVAEVMFDILQQEKLGQLTFVGDRQDTLDASLTLLNPEQTLKQAQQTWETWSDAGLSNLSPNLAPVLRQLEQLQQQSSTQVYQTLVKVIDGDRTLRDVAVLLKQDLLMLVRSFVRHYVSKGLMALVRVPDFSPAAPPEPERESNAGAASPSQPASAAQPLIACVDDSRLEQQLMELMLTKAGYRFLGIQDSIQVLPTLLEHKPNLIFLDLVMPVANGYEVCTQIRRISLFKNIPVVILTGNDGIVDRVRAKMVGSTDFLSKPIEAEQVLAILRKYLPTPTSLPERTQTGRQLLPKFVDN